MEDSSISFQESHHVAVLVPHSVHDGTAIVPAPPHACKHCTMACSIMAAQQHTLPRCTVPQSGQAACSSMHCVQSLEVNCGCRNSPPPEDDAHHQEAAEKPHRMWFYGNGVDKSCTVACGQYKAKPKDTKSSKNSCTISHRWWTCLAYLMMYLLPVRTHYITAVILLSKRCNSARNAY